MTDPYVAPDNETPTQRRHRLLNLTNPSWQPQSDAVDETAPTVAPAEAGAAEPEPPPPATEPEAAATPPPPAKQQRSAKDK